MAAGRMSFRGRLISLPVGRQIVPRLPIPLCPPLSLFYPTSCVRKRRTQRSNVERLATPYLSLFAVSSFDIHAFALSFICFNAPRILLSFHRFFPRSFFLRAALDSLKTLTLFHFQRPLFESETSGNKHLTASEILLDVWPDTVFFLPRSKLSLLGIVDHR